MERTQVIGWFDEIGLVDRPLVGGKGGSLGELDARLASRCRPASWSRRRPSTRSSRRWKRRGPLRATIEALDAQDLPSITRVTAAIRERVEHAPLPAALREAIGCGTRATVRGQPPCRWRYDPPPPRKTRRTRASPACRTPTCG
jgi:hypothetical protein